MTSPDTARGEIVVLQEGHTDLGVIYENNELLWRLDLDGVTLEGGAVGNGLLDPSQAAIRVPDVQGVLFQNQSFGNPSFTGYLGSGPFWFLPSTGGVDGAPFLGWSYDLENAGTSAINLSAWEGSGITVRLTDWEVPEGGQFSLWTGTAPLVSTFDPNIASRNSFVLPPHNHFNFGFTAEGLYDMTFLASGIHKVDGFQETTGTFRFLVGDATAVPEPSSLALLCLGTIGFAARARKKIRTKPSR